MRRRLRDAGSARADPGTQAGGARRGTAAAPRWLDPPAPVTTGAESSRGDPASADDRVPALDAQPVARDAADPLDEQRRSTALIRSCSVASSSSGSTATAACARIGPVSTPSSTTITVQPVTLHAVRERVPHAVRAGERRQQRRVGVDDPPAEPPEERGPEELHEPGQHDQVGREHRDRLRDRGVPRGTVVEVLDATRRPSGCRPRARSRAPGCCARSATTATTRAP